MLVEQQMNDLKRVVYKTPTAGCSESTSFRVGDFLATVSI